MGAGLAEAPLLLGPECAGGCSVQLLLSVPRLPDADYAPPAIPTSKIFDPRAPHSHTLSGAVAVRPPAARGLDVAVEVVPSGGGGGAAATAEGQVAMLPGAEAQVGVARVFQCGCNVGDVFGRC